MTINIESSNIRHDDYFRLSKANKRIIDHDF